MKKRTTIVRKGVTLLVILAGAIGAFVALRNGDSTENVPPAAVFKTVAIEAGSLDASESVDGTTTLSDVTEVLHRIPATTSPSSRRAPSASTAAADETELITSVIAVGATAAPGAVLYSAESKPVIALAGTTPAWRALKRGIADGIDVYQLETNLVALGYDPDGDITVDNHFDYATTTAVKAWQTGYGMNDTGQVSLGTVVFLASTATVSQVNVAVGDKVADGASIVLLAGAAQEIVIDVPDGLEAYLTPGVVVQLAGDAEGTVSLLRSIEREGEIVVQAIITPSAPLVNATSGTIVKVRVPTARLDDVLIVPREALVSRLDGTYAIQVVTAPDTTEFRSVTVLGESGADCAISGDGITAGTDVLQPI